jgi:hypothetical protein
MERIAVRAVAGTDPDLGFAVMTIDVEPVVSIVTDAASSSGSLDSLEVEGSQAPASSATTTMTPDFIK